METTELIYSAIALNHIKKQGGEMLNDFAEVLKNAGETRSVNSLLNMSVKDFLKTNAIEVMTTQEAGFGKEFVQEAVLATEIVDRVKTSTYLLERANVKDMNARKQSFAVRGTALRMVAIPENTVIPKKKNIDAQVKKAHTATVSIDTTTLVITIYYTDELLEDSVVNMAEFVLGEITSAYENSIYQILINGDVETGDKNINANGASVDTLEYGAGSDLLKFDGIRKNAIKSGTIVDAQQNLTLEVIRAARAKMGMKGVNPEDLVMIVDIDTYFGLMNLTEVETIDKFGDAATVKNGKLAAIDGIRIDYREEMGLADATGKIDGVKPANNTTGQLAIVHAPSLFVGIRRGLRTEVSRYPEELTTGITGSARVGIAFNDIQNTIKPTKSVALVVNI